MQLALYILLMYQYYQYTDIGTDTNITVCVGTSLFVCVYVYMCACVDICMHLWPYDCASETQYSVLFTDCETSLPGTFMAYKYNCTIRMHMHDQEFETSKINSWYDAGNYTNWWSTIQII